MKSILLFILKVSIASFLIFLARKISDTFLLGGITGIIYSAILDTIDSVFKEE